MTKNGPRGLRVARQLLQGTAFVLAGCSVLYELSADQCETDADCAALGFSDNECIRGTCDPRSDPTTTTDNGSTTGAGGEMGSGGAGTGGCSSNAQCIDDNFDQPYICRDGDCIPLIDEDLECPLVLAGEGSNSHPYLRRDNPIIFGAYSKIGTTADLKLSQPTLNYDLALEEINDELGGGLSDSGDRRPFVAVICDGLSDNLDTSMEHLVNTVKVPAIIAPLQTDRLLDVFEGYARDSQTFILSPFEADTTLIDADQNGLMWHLLGSAEELAVGYVPLVERAETYVRDVVLEGDDATDLKVALVEADAPFLLDISNYVVENVSTNGEFLFNQSEDTFQRFRIQSALSPDGADPVEIAEVGAELKAWGPHIILLITSEEVALNDIFLDIEGAFPGGQMGFAGIDDRGYLPFYLLSPYLFAVPATLEAIEAGAGSPPLAARALGINFAAAEDPTLYNLYLSSLKTVNDDVPFSLEGTENFYDAAYYLMYGMAAGLAGSPANFRGIHIAQNFERVLDLGAMRYDTKPANVANGMNAVYQSSQTSIALYGTLGPPNFNFSTGARRTPPSVYCVGNEGDGFEFQPDVMTYDAGDASFSGDPPCVPDF